MAAFLSVYGGYHNLTLLLDELRRFDVDLDPRECCTVERLTYILWCVASGAIALIGVALYVRDSTRYLLFRWTMAAPAALYTPIFLGFTGACLDTNLAQEESFCLCLLIIEPMMALLVLRLMCDAYREGLNARYFDLPLRRAEWRWLLFCLAYHALIFLTAVIMLSYEGSTGRMLLALEASLALRSVRPHPTECPEAEIYTTLAVLALSTLLAAGGHCSLRRWAPRASQRGWLLGVTLPSALQAACALVSLGTCLDTESSQEVLLFSALTAASAVGGAVCVVLTVRPEVGALRSRPAVAAASARNTGVGKRRRSTEEEDARRGGWRRWCRCCRWCHWCSWCSWCHWCHWCRRGARPHSRTAGGGGAPAGADGRPPSRSPAAAADGAPPSSADARGVAPPVATPPRWLMVALLPYHGSNTAACATCLLWHLTDGPLMTDDFLTVWDRSPQVQISHSPYGRVMAEIP